MHISIQALLLNGLPLTLVEGIVSLRRVCADRRSGAVLVRVVSGEVVLSSCRASTLGVPSGAEPSQGEADHDQAGLSEFL